MSKLYVIKAGASMGEADEYKPSAERIAEIRDLCNIEAQAGRGARDATLAVAKAVARELVPGVTAKMIADSNVFKADGGTPYSRSTIDLYGKLGKESAYWPTFFNGGFAAWRKARRDAEYAANPEKAERKKVLQKAKALTKAVEQEVKGFKELFRFLPFDQLVEQLAARFGSDLDSWTDFSEQVTEKVVATMEAEQEQEQEQEQNTENVKVVNA